MTDPHPLSTVAPPRADRTARVLVLRLWLAEPAEAPGAPRWRCILQDAHTGQHRGFGSAAELLAFLASALDEPRADS